MKTEVIKESGLVKIVFPDGSEAIVAAKTCGSFGNRIEIKTNELHHIVSISKPTSDRETATVSRMDSIEGTIRIALLAYWRWVCEGRPQYKDSQYYYDPYHYGIAYLGDGVYKYNIQLGDSPEGDTWESGKFRYTVTGIEFLKE